MGRKTQKIGNEYEAHLNTYLKTLFQDSEHEIRRCNSGLQGGKDLVAKLSNVYSYEMDLSQKKYTWFFESKGGSKNSKSRNNIFKLSSEKILQVLADHDPKLDRDIVCWCIFAPHLEMDGNEDIRIGKLKHKLPFNIVIWDKRYVQSRIFTANKELYKQIYKDERCKPNDLTNVKLCNEILEQTCEGRMINLMAQKQSDLRNEIENSCCLTVTFYGEIYENNNEIKERHYFSFNGLDYDILKTDLDSLIGRISEIKESQNSIESNLAPDFCYAPQFSI